MSTIKEIIREWLEKKAQEKKFELSKSTVEVSKNGQWSLKKAKLNIPSEWSIGFKAEQKAKQEAQNIAQQKARLKDPLTAGQTLQQKITQPSKTEGSIMPGKSYSTIAQVKQAMSPPKPSPKPPRAGESLNRLMRGGLDGLFEDLSEARDAGNTEEYKNIKDEIKSHVAEAKQGDIDLGQLYNLFEKHHHRRGEKYDSPMHFTDDEFGEMAEPHLRGMHSLKEVHDKLGGTDAIKGILMTHGANGQTQMGEMGTGYIHITRSPQLLSQIVNAVNPGKGNVISDYEGDQHHIGDAPWEHIPIEKDHQDKVDESFKNMTDVAQNDDHKALDKHATEHENAVVERALHRFKTHYGID